MLKTLTLLTSVALGVGFAAPRVSSMFVCAAPTPAASVDPDAAEPAGFTYVEARDTTVWGGACHVSGDAACYGRRAACAFDFGDARVVLSIAGDRNLQGAEVFRAGGTAEVRVEAWVDAPDVDAALARAYAQIVDLPAPAAVHAHGIEFSVSSDAFQVVVPGQVELAGEPMPDRACCTMPESRWYAPLAQVDGSIVGNAERCRVSGPGLGAWAFEGENSVFLARFPG